MKWLTYNSNTNRWNFPEQTGAVRVFQRGETIPDSVLGIQADHYTAAFQKLTGQAFTYPPCTGQLRQSNRAAA